MRSNGAVVEPGRVGVRPIIPPAPVKGRKSPVHWTPREAQAVADAYWTLLAENPEGAKRALAIEAQDAVLPPERRKDIRGFNQKYVNILLNDLDQMRPAPAVPAPEPEPPPADGGAGASPGRVYWTMEEKRELVRVGADIRLKDPTIGLKALLGRAQETILPQERHRDVGHTARSQFEWYEGAVSERVAILRAEAMVVVEATPPAPTVTDPDGKQLLEKVSDSTLCAVLFTRILSARSSDTAALRAVAADVRTLAEQVGRLAEHSRVSDLLLRRIALDLDPAALQAIEAPPAPPQPLALPQLVTAPAVVIPPVVQPQKPPPKMRVMLVGFLGNQEQTILKLSKDFGVLTFVPTGREACSRGFAGQDLVIVSRHNGHPVFEAAKKSVGVENAIRMRSTSAHSAVQVIRERHALFQRKWAKEHEHQCQNGSISTATRS